MTSRPTVTIIAPANKCAVCSKDATTGLAFEGEADLIVVSLVELGVSTESAVAMLNVGPEELSELRPRRTPVVVCFDCAAKAGRTVDDFPTIPVYVLPEEPPDEP